MELQRGGGWDMENYRGFSLSSFSLFSLYKSNTCRVGLSDGLYLVRE